MLFLVLTSLCQDWVVDTVPIQRFKFYLFQLQDMDALYCHVLSLPPCVRIVHLILKKGFKFYSFQFTRHGCHVLSFLVPTSLCQDWAIDTHKGISVLLIPITRHGCSVLSFLVTTSLCQGWVLDTHTEI